MFDLDLPFRATAGHEHDIDLTIRELAAEQATALTYEVFKDQVVPFLDGPIAALYDDRAWDRIQATVVSELLR